MRYMLGFDVKGTEIQQPQEDEYEEPLDNIPKRYGREDQVGRQA